MEWFKHYNKASEGESFQRLIAEKDFECLFGYWWLLEQVAKFEREDSRGKITLNFSYFKMKLNWNLQRSVRVLQKIAKTFKMEININSDESVEVFVPNWLELQENRGGKRLAKILQKNSKNSQEERSKNKELEVEIEKADPGEFHPLILIWNSASNLAKVNKTNKSRDQKISAIWPLLSCGEWREVVQKIDASDFCIGKNDQGWKATFDWLLQKETYLKVMEGKYDNRSKGKAKGFSDQRADSTSDFEAIANGRPRD